MSSKDSSDAIGGPAHGPEPKHQGRARLRLVEPPSDSAEHGDSHDRADEPAELNLRVLQPIFRYVRHEFGEETLHKLVRDSGLPDSSLRRSAPWVSHERFERVLKAVREMVPSDQEFMRACAYDMRKVYGPMVLLLRCMTVRSAYYAMAKTSHLISRISGFEIVASTRTMVRLRYTSDRPESRLMCLSRQAQQRLGPSLWLDHAPGVLEERSCIAQGDDACVYDIRWHEPFRYRRALFGAIVGLLAAAAFPLGAMNPAFVYSLLPILGLASGAWIEHRRMLAEYVQFHDQTTLEFERVVHAHARAVDEILALHERERQWSARLESDIAERSSQLERVVAKLQSLGKVREDKLRTLSHDMSNPLTVLASATIYLRESKAIRAPEDAESIEAMDAAVQQLSTLMNELVDIIRESPREQQLLIESVDVDEMTHRMRRQLKATVMGRDIRITVFPTREAPKQIRTIPLLLERVVDNLLTNACKYTARGSIVVEVGGVPGSLQLKISDTGRGIGSDRMEQVFMAGQPDPDPPAVGRSHGDGLGIVVRLLDQLHGRLEIMSEPGVGTTLWVYIPTEYSGPSPTSSQAPIKDFAEAMQRVVKIRTRPDPSPPHRT